MTATQPQPIPTTPDQRAWALAQAVQAEVAAGARVEAMTGETATVVRGTTPAHVAHLIATIFTFGLWSPIWLLCCLVQQERRVLLSVDPWGNVHHTRGPRR